MRRAEAATTVAEQAAARYRELLEGSRRLLVAACDDDAVRAAVDADADAGRSRSLRGYLARLLQRFPADYSRPAGDRRQRDGALRQHAARRAA